MTAAQMLFVAGVTVLAITAILAIVTILALAYQRAIDHYSAGRHE